MSESLAISAEIQRQYNEVIAPSYDLDPQQVAGRSLARALSHLQEESCLSAELPQMNVLDLGLGTGAFIVKLRKMAAREIRPFGLDLSEKMIEIAQQRVPDLVPAIDDAANIDQHFTDHSFDLICTHFITGFVSIEHLAPRIFSKLKPGGYWSFVGATRESFPGLQAKAQNRLLRMMFGRGRELKPEELLVPIDCDAVTKCFTRHGFETSAAETVHPDVYFKNFDDFMEFGYRGSWLTAFIEEVGLHKAGPLLRATLNKLVFPIRDHHTVAIGLARRPLV